MPAILVRRRTFTLIALAGVALAVAILLEARTPDGPAATPSLGARTVQAGDVKVHMTALSLDTSGARFRIILDTHSGSLDVDLTQGATLRVSGNQPAVGSWSGAAAGGHHREGTLTFTTAVPAGAAVELRITGLPADVVGTWTAP